MGENTDLETVVAAEESCSWQKGHIEYTGTELDDPWFVDSPATKLIITYWDDEHPKKTLRKMTHMHCLKESARAYGADVSAGISMYTPLMGILELIQFAGDLDKVLVQRLSGITFNLVFGRFFGKYIDKCRDWTGSEAEDVSLVKKMAVDTGSMLTFYGPIYFSTHMYNGSDAMEAGGATLAASVICAVTGGAYGRFLNFMRKKWGVPPNARLEGKDFDGTWFWEDDPDDYRGDAGNREDYLGKDLDGPWLVDKV